MAKILSFSASNSKHSINKTLLDLAMVKISDHQVKNIEVLDFPMPFYSLDLEKTNGVPEAAKQIRALFVEYDAIVIASPEHNGLPPAEFKNLMDWVSRVEQGPLFGETMQGAKKPVLLLSASPGPNGGATNLQNLSQLMPWWGADIKGVYSLGRFFDNFTENKLSVTEDDKLTQLMAEFTASL